MPGTLTLFKLIIILLLLVLYFSETSFILIDLWVQSVETILQRSQQALCLSGLLLKCTIVTMLDAVRILTCLTDDGRCCEATYNFSVRHGNSCWHCRGHGRLQSWRMTLLTLIYNLYSICFAALRGSWFLISYFFNDLCARFTAHKLI